MPTRTLPLLLILLAGCAHDEGPGRAKSAFASFQRALQRGDGPACRALLTRESRPVVAELPWEDLAARAPLEIVGARRVRDNAEEYHVDVLDPNEDRKPGRYVVVREYGQLVVDLVASAGLTARAAEAGSGEERFEPAALTPADFDRIREYELSQPPAKPGGN